MTETEAAPVEAPAVKVSDDATITEAPQEVVDMTLPGGEKLLAALGYIGFFCILPLLAKPKSEICQHHGKQAMAVTLMFFLGSAVVYNAGMLLRMQALLTLAILINIAWAAVAIMGMMSASAGKKTSIPFFGSIAKKLTW